MTATRPQCVDDLYRFSQALKTRRIVVFGCLLKRLGLDDLGRLANAVGALNLANESNNCVDILSGDIGNGGHIAEIPVMLSDTAPSG